MTSQIRSSFSGLFALKFFCDHSYNIRITSHCWVSVQPGGHTTAYTSGTCPAAPAVTLPTA
jgi:hypothetical protein